MIRFLAQLKYQTVLRVRLVVIHARVLFAPTGQGRSFAIHEQAQVQRFIRTPLNVQLFLANGFLFRQRTYLRLNREHRRFGPSHCGRAD